MPIARYPSGGSSTGVAVTSTSFIAGEPLSAGQAVAVIYEAGVELVRPCGAAILDYGRSFIGFSKLACMTGRSPTLIVGRGSIVAPIVQGAIPLVPNAMVYLSTVPGQVTQTPPVTAGTMIIPLGIATSPTKILLTTDYRVKNS